MADLDSRLSHPRRRVADTQLTLPNLGQPDFTSEMIDEIAWRVAELLRSEKAVRAQGEAVAAAIARSVSAPPATEDEPALPEGIAVSIRIRRPLFRWPFRRKRRRSMMTFSDYRVT